MNARFFSSPLVRHLSGAALLALTAGAFVLPARGAEDAETIMAQASAFEDAKDLDHAIEQVSKLVQIAPQNADGYFWLARLYRENGDFARAIEISEKGIMLSPSRRPAAIWNNAYTLVKWSEALEARGDYYAAAGKQKQSLSMLGQLGGASEADLKGASVKEAQYAGQQRMAKLEEEQHQDDLRAAREAVGRGGRYADQGRMALAERELLNALDLNPDDSVGWKELGRCRARQGNFPQSVEAFKKAISLDPKFKVAWNNLGAAQNELKQYDEAIASFDQAIALDPGYTVAINNKALACQMKGDLPQAAATYAGVLKIDPKNAEAHFNIAGLAVMQKDYEGALEHCRQVLAIKPFNQPAWSLTGDICMILNRNDDAIDAYQKALIIEPGDKDVQANLKKAQDARDAGLMSKYFNRQAAPGPAEGVTPAEGTPPADAAAAETTATAEQTPAPEPTRAHSPTGRTRAHFDEGPAPQPAMPEPDAKQSTDAPISVPAEPAETPEAPEAPAKTAE